MLISIPIVIFELEQLFVSSQSECEFQKHQPTTPVVIKKTVGRPIKAEAQAKREALAAAAALSTPMNKNPHSAGPEMKRENQKRNNTMSPTGAGSSQKKGKKHKTMSPS